jgi:hypothetical protein
MAAGLFPLLASMARTLRACPKGQWWWPEEEGALGQALHTGLWTSQHGNSVMESMPKKEGAQLYATTYWNSGVLLASIMHCRETVTTAIKDLDLPTISPSLHKPGPGRDRRIDGGTRSRHDRTCHPDLRRV